MVPTPLIKPTLGPAASTSRVVDTDVSSSAMSRMVTSVLGSPTFLASDLMASRVDLARVFQLATTFCERGSVVATNAKVSEGVDAGDVVVEQPVISGVDSP
jgi:NAD-dependent oxidoreductase involved in siderophore biosynthesis